MATLKHGLVGTAVTLLSLSVWAQAPIVDAQAAPAAQYRQPQQSVPASSGSDMYTQLQQLRSEVMELRGKVEEQAFQIRQLKQQSLDRYIELDRRIGATQGGASVTAAPSETPVSKPPAMGTQEESAEYRAAYNLVKSQKFAEAIPAFKNFIASYPAGRYTPNAWYWLGELYLVNSPQNLAASANAFGRLLENYPDNSKAADAMYKLGKVKFLQGDKATAKQWLDRVVTEHEGSSAAKLAREFLRQSF